MGDEKRGETASLLAHVNVGQVAKSQAIWRQ